MSTFNDMVDFISAAWPARKFIVPCLEGPAGIGKTAAVKEAARELSDLAVDGATGKVVTIIASQILPNEVSGITMPVVESKAMEIFDHFRLSSLNDGDILFFDELLEADQLVLSACLTLIESRELMSGRKLPDVMIVAATNPTIQPNMLKENIRQRFMWQKFDIDFGGCCNYIMDNYGLDVTTLGSQLQSTGNEYNILTPRSLTKLAGWMASARSHEEASRIATQINRCWKSTIGLTLLEAYKEKMSSESQQMRNALRTAMLDICETVPDDIMTVIENDDTFKETSMTELWQMLTELPEWKSIEKALSSTMMEESDESKVSF